MLLHLSLFFLPPLQLGPCTITTDIIHMMKKKYWTTLCAKYYHFGLKMGRKKQICAACFIQVQDTEHCHCFLIWELMNILVLLLLKDISSHQLEHQRACRPYYALHKSTNNLQTVTQEHLHCRYCTFFFKKKTFLIVFRLTFYISIWNKL